MAAYRGLLALGYGSVAVAGDSAGGGLALTTVAQAQTASACVAYSAWTDLALTGASIRERAAIDPILTEWTVAGASESYLHGHDARDPLASPLYGDVAGIPPVQLQVGTEEILFDDTLRYVERANSGGVDATAHLCEGMPHIFPLSVGTFEAATNALEVSAAFLRQHLG
jgi:monoterpene epsilon-lactone hydrolase